MLPPPMKPRLVKSVTFPVLGNVLRKRRSVSGEMNFMKVPSISAYVANKREASSFRRQLIHRRAARSDGSRRVEQVFSRYSC
jgi:hypothetical protein